MQFPIYIIGGAEALLTASVRNASGRYPKHSGVLNNWRASLGPTEIAPRRHSGGFRWRALPRFLQSLLIDRLSLFDRSVHVRVPDIVESPIATRTDLPAITSKRSWLDLLRRCNSRNRKKSLKRRVLLSEMGADAKRKRLSWISSGAAPTGGSWAPHTGSRLSALGLVGCRFPSRAATEPSRQ